MHKLRQWSNGRIQVSFHITQQNWFQFYLVRVNIAFLYVERYYQPYGTCLNFDVFRLDMLQQIANRVQRDSLSCEDKLMLARNATQSVSSFEYLVFDFFV